MSTKLKRIIIIVIELLLVVGVMAAMWFITSKTVSATNVLVYSHDMNIGTVISKDDLQVVQIPAKAVTSNFPTNTKDVLGKVITFDAKKGDYVSLSQLTTTEEESLTLDDVAVLRTKSFPVQMSTALAGNIKKGDKIDLTYIGRVDNGYGNESVYAKTFMTNVRVWAVSTQDGYAYTPRDSEFWNETSFAGEGSEAAGGSDRGELSIVTVMCTPAQVEEISARLVSGTIQISGHFSVSDDVQTQGYTISGNSLYTGSVEAPPAPASTTTTVNAAAGETSSSRSTSSTSSSGSSGGGGLF